eukprot:4096423-Amphidinium_carterae.1
MIAWQSQANGKLELACQSRLGVVHQARPSRAELAIIICFLFAALVHIATIRVSDSHRVITILGTAVINGFGSSFCNASRRNGGVASMMVTGAIAALAIAH